LINFVEEATEKEINVIRFSELNPKQVHEIVFVPDFYYDEDGTPDDCKVG